MKEKCELRDYGDEHESAEEKGGLEKLLFSDFSRPHHGLSLDERWKRWVEIIDR